MSIQMIVIALIGGGFALAANFVAFEMIDGAHQAASILTLEAVSQLLVDDRPIVLGTHAAATSEETFAALSQFAITQPVNAGPSLHFDRDSRFGYNNSLTYQIVVDWVIAEHKSQGLFQNRCRQDRFENFWVFRAGKDLPDNSSNIFSGSRTMGGDAGPVQVSQSGNKK
jgi:hypothetical protein